MLVSQRVAASFKLVHEVLIPGVAQLLRFVPLSSNHLCSHPFLVLNAYLQSGDPAIAISQMQAISDLVPDPPRYSFGGADWNLTERRQDSNGAHDHFASTPQAREAFSKLSKHFDWTEIYHSPASTPFSMLHMCVSCTTCKGLL